jgi:glycine hydroxymethyltransferase
LELRADKNYIFSDILKLQSSILYKSNEEYSEDENYSHDFVKLIFDLANDYACKLFKCKFVNVFPLSVLEAKSIVYEALLKDEDIVMSMETDGKDLESLVKKYQVVNYGVNPETEIIDYDNVRRVALDCKPQLIIVNSSSYSRIIDFKKFREIADEVGAYLLADISYLAGLITTGAYPSPINYADVVITSTSMTLRGPKGGLILTNKENIISLLKENYHKKAGVPLITNVMTKAECFTECLDKEFTDYIIRVLKNAKVLTECLQNEDIKVISGGTDNHLLLIDLKSYQLTNIEAEALLAKINIKSDICTDRAFLKLSSMAMTSRGLNEHDFQEIGKIIAKCLKNKNNEIIQNELVSRVLEIAKNYPIY